MNLIKVALIIAFSLVLVACKSTRLKDINKNIRVLTLNEIKLTSGEPYTFSSWKCKDYFEGGKLIIEDEVKAPKPAKTAPKKPAPKAKTKAKTGRMR